MNEHGAEAARKEQLAKWAAVNPDAAEACKRRVEKEERK